MLYVINMKCTLWSILELIGSVTRTRVLYCQILFNSCWAGDWQSNWLHWILSLKKTCVFFTSLLGSVFYAWTLLLLSGCQLWFLHSCVCLIGFSYLIQCFITDQCFITVLSWQLDNCLTTFFPVNSGPLSFTGCKKALKCCPQFMPLGSSLPGPSSIYL